MRVRGHLAFVLSSFIDQGFHFFKAILRRTDRSDFGQDAASRTGLDHAGAVLNLVTNGGANFVRTVGYSFFDPRIQQPRTKSIIVAMATGDAQRVPRGLHSWS